MTTPFPPPRSSYLPPVAGEALGIRYRDAAGGADGVELLWERHSEARTTTIISPSHDDAPFVACPGASDALDWLEAAPGRVIRATRLAIVADEAAAAAVLPGLGFAPSEVVSCRLGAARLWSDFHLHVDRYGRLLISAGVVTPADPGPLRTATPALGHYPT